MARETSRISLNSSERMWYDIMDGDLYRELLLPGGFLNNPDHLSLLFNTDGVHAFKASRDEIWPLLVTINELHPSVRLVQFRLFQKLSTPKFVGGNSCCSHPDRTKREC